LERNLHAQEIKKFSDVVYTLAHESEPHRSRINFLNQSARSIKKVDSKMMPLSPSTLTHSLKDKYVVRA
jgi:hypothetical protein